MAHVKRNRGYGNKIRQRRHRISRYQYAYDRTYYAFDRLGRLLGTIKQAAIGSEACAAQLAGRSNWTGFDFLQDAAEFIGAAA